MREKKSGIRRNGHFIAEAVRFIIARGTEICVDIINILLTSPEGNGEEYEGKSAITLLAHAGKLNA